MSLFSSREWWTTTLGSSEEFDQGCLCVANIDNDPAGTGDAIYGQI
jgi:Bardet-Biedl syndrome 9 protein